jgi:hypothetical protein
MVGWRTLSPVSIADFSIFSDCHEEEPPPRILSTRMTRVWMGLMDAL